MPYVCVQHKRICLVLSLAIGQPKHVFPLLLALHLPFLDSWNASAFLLDPIITMQLTTVFSSLVVLGGLAVAAPVDVPDEEPCVDGIICFDALSACGVKYGGYFCLFFLLSSQQVINSIIAATTSARPTRSPSRPLARPPLLSSQPRWSS